MISIQIGISVSKSLVGSLTKEVGKMLYSKRKDEETKERKL